MCVLNEKKVDAHKRREAFRCFIKLMISYTSGKNGATVYIEIARHLNIIRIDFIDQPDCCRSKTFRAFGWKRKWRFKHMKLINSISFRFVSFGIVCAYANEIEQIPTVPSGKF